MPRRNFADGVVEMDGVKLTMRSGCILFDGGMSIRTMGIMAKLAPTGAVIDTNLARMAGVGLAVGRPEDTARLRAELAPEAVEQARKRFPGVPHGVAEWLGSGEQGMSSLALLLGTTGVHAPNLRIERDELPVPHDADDLRRCLLLEEAVPVVQDRIAEMAKVSVGWAAIVARWSELRAALDSEAPEWRAGKGMGKVATEMLRALADGVTAQASRSP